MTVGAGGTGGTKIEVAWALARVETICLRSLETLPAATAAQFHTCTSEIPCSFSVSSLARGGRVVEKSVILCANKLLRGWLLLLLWGLGLGLWSLLECLHLCFELFVSSRELLNYREEANITGVRSNYRPLRTAFAERALEGDGTAFGEPVIFQGFF